MTDAELRIAREARETLYLDAKRARRHGADEQQWLFDAPQWALDALTQREVDAVIGMTWKGSR